MRMARLAVSRTVPWTLGWAVAWAVAAATLAPPLRAQDRVSLEAVTAEVMRHWEAGLPGELADLLDPGGVRVRTPAASYPAMEVRQAVAALKELHDESGVGPVERRQLHALGGQPPSGFAELVWRPLPSGVAEPVERTVYVGYEWSDGRWRIVEIRILDAGEPRTAMREERWRSSSTTR